MSDEWYYTRDQQQYGPFEFNDLVEMSQKGVLARHDLLWKEGMANWQPAETIHGLFTAPSAPEPITDAPPAWPPTVSPDPNENTGYVSPFAKQAASMPPPTVPPMQPQPAAQQAAPDYSVSQQARARSNASGGGDSWIFSAGCMIRIILAIIGLIIGIISAIIEAG